MQDIFKNKIQDIIGNHRGPERSTKEHCIQKTKKQNVLDSIQGLQDHPRKLKKESYLQRSPVHTQNNPVRLKNESETCSKVNPKPKPLNPKP